METSYEPRVENIEKGCYDVIRALMIVPEICIHMLPIIESGAAMLYVGGWLFGIEDETQRIIIIAPDSPYKVGIDLKWAGWKTYQEPRFGGWVTAPIDPIVGNLILGPYSKSAKILTRFRPRQIAPNIAYFIQGRFTEMVEQNPDEDNPDSRVEPLIIHKWELLKALGYGRDVTHAYKVVYEALRLLMSTSVTRVWNLDTPGSRADSVFTTYLIGSFVWPYGKSPVMVYIDPLLSRYLRELNRAIIAKTC